MTKTKPTAPLSSRPLQAAVIFAPFLIGVYHEWTACLLSVYLIGCLLYYRKKRGSIVVPFTPASLASAVLALFFGLSALWAVDRGMALMGFVKFLPMPLFALAIGQLTSEDREGLLAPLPWAGAVMTLLSGLLSLIPALSEVFLVNRRLGGFFQYPNTFAIYLLLGVVPLLFRKKLTLKDAAPLPFLLAGIALSGSRTVFLLMAAIVVYYLIWQKDKRLRLAVIGAAVLLVALTGAYALITGNFSSIARYLTISTSSTTFLGRFLYFQDAIPVIAKHPFGLGYIGYQCTQGSFKTGVYHILYVHNDLLQIMLDVGWIPALLFIWAVVRSFFPGRCSHVKKIMLAVLCAHCMFDFDMQFVAMDLLFLLIADNDPIREFSWKNRHAAHITAALTCVLCLYAGLVSGLFFLKSYHTVLRLYPYYTAAWESVITEADTAESMDAIAEHILKTNKSVSLAWDAKARAAYANGDFAAVIEYKRRAIALQRYALDEYLDYFDMMEMGYALYTQAGDTGSAAYCLERLREIPEMLAQVREETSSLGWKIQNQPITTLPDRYQERLDALIGG